MVLHYFSLLHSFENEQVRCATLETNQHNSSHEITFLLHHSHGPSSSLLSTTHCSSLHPHRTTLKHVDISHRPPQTGRLQEYRPFFRCMRKICQRLHENRHPSNHWFIVSCHSRRPFSANLLCQTATPWSYAIALPTFHFDIFSSQRTFILPSTDPLWPTVFSSVLAQSCFL